MTTGGAEQPYRPLVRPALPADVAFIDDLRGKEWASVGFVPMVRYQEETDGRRRGMLLVVEENGEPCGFVFASYGRQLSAIHQLVVTGEVRRKEKGKALLDSVANLSEGRGKFGLRCRVAADLEACAFWEAMGFIKIGEGMGKVLGKPVGRHSRIISKFERLVVPRLFTQGGDGERHG